MDRLISEQRSSLMWQVASRNTKPEIAARALLQGLEYAFDVHIIDPVATRSDKTALRE